MNENKERYKEMLPIIEEWCNNPEAELHYDGHKATWLSFDYPAELWEVKYPKKTIIVNGVEVLAPEQKELKFNTTYFVSSVEDDTFFVEYTWDNSAFDIINLERGIIYLNKEDAIARAKAMLHFTEKK